MRARNSFCNESVKTTQPLGMLAAYLLEPQAEDGLCTWNYFDPGLLDD